MLTPFALAVHTYRPAYDRRTGEGSVSGLEVVLPEVVRDPTVPAGYEVQVTLVELAVQVNVYDVIVPNVAAGEIPPVMVTLMDWALTVKMVHL